MFLLADDREIHRFSKGIKGGLLLYTEEETFFLFNYGGKRYLMHPDFYDEVFRFEDSRFLRDRVLSGNDHFAEAVSIKYCHAFDNGSMFVSDQADEEPGMILSKRQVNLVELMKAIEGK